MSPKKAKITSTLDEAMRRDLILFNNPVLIQGLALTPVIAASVSLKSGLLLSIVAIILIIPTRIVGDLLVGFVAKNLRPMVYAMIAALCYIPAHMLIVFLFGNDITAGLLYHYLPLLVVDGVVLSRAEIPAREGILRALRNGIFTALGTSMVLLGVGCARELLTKGSITIGRASSSASAAPGWTLSVFATVAGGLIIVALLSALVQWGGATYKRTQMGGTKVNE